MFGTSPAFSPLRTGGARALTSPGLPVWWVNSGTLDLCYLPTSHQRQRAGKLQCNSPPPFSSLPPEMSSFSSEATRCWVSTGGGSRGIGRLGAPELSLQGQLLPASPRPQSSRAAEGTPNKPGSGSARGAAASSGHRQISTPRLQGSAPEGEGRQRQGSFSRPDKAKPYWPPPEESWERFKTKQAVMTQLLLLRVSC